MRDKVVQDRTRLQERYLQDDLPTRLGGLATNWHTSNRFHHSGNQAAVERLLEESSLSGQRVKSILIVLPSW